MSRLVKLKKITAKIGSGATPRGGQNAYQTQGISLVRSQNVLDFRFSMNGLAFINEDQAESLNNVTVEDGDILLNITGDSIARVCIVPSEILPARVNQHVAIIRCNDEVDNKYVFYYLQYMKSYLLKICGVGGTRNALTKEALEKLDIVLQDNQKARAAVLSSLDSKIELNNKINAELEAMAKTLYDYWFVQFDFPDSDGKPYKTSGGKMVWNDELKREIPDGWEVGTLSEISNITMGQSPVGESYNTDKNGIIFFQGCTDFGIRFPTVRQFTTEPTRYAKEGDILLSVRAPVGTINIAKENCCIGRGLAALNSKDNCIAYLFGVMVNLKQIFDRRNVDGTTFGSITKDDLFSLTVIKPSKEILKKYHETITPAFQKQNQIELENQTLSELRDWLLPMLMNGQVRIQ